MPCNENTRREFVRTDRRWDSCKRRYVNVKIYRKVKVKRIEDLRQGDRHPQTGRCIPSPNDKYASYPGKGFCRTVKVTKITKYKRNRWGDRIRVSGPTVTNRTPVSGWHPCKKTNGGCR